MTKILNQKVNKIKNPKYEAVKLKSRDILLSSTIHGIQGIVKKSNRLVKIVWFICLLISIIICAFFVSTSILNFLDFEIVTQISTIYETQSEFPTISICASKGSLNSSTILNCEFNRDDCKSKIEIFQDKVLGECLKFNGGINLTNQSTDVLTSPVAGINFGLYLDIAAIKNSLNDYTELTILIHNKSFKPIVLNNSGFRISSGSINTIMIERTFDEKLEPPYNDCYKNIDDFNQNKTIINFIKQTNSSYSQLECIRYCRNLYLMETSECNCVTSIDAVTDCSQSVNKTTKDCYLNFVKNFQKLNVFNLCSKYCPLECDSIDYKTYINTEQLPTSGNITGSLDFYFNYGMKTYEEIQKRFFRIVAYYPDLKYTYINQQPKTLMVDLVSNIGGTLGLFIGISFLSIVEIFELIIEIIAIMIS